MIRGSAARVVIDPAPLLILYILGKENGMF